MQTLAATAAPTVTVEVTVTAEKLPCTCNGNGANGNGNGNINGNGNTPDTPKPTCTALWCWAASTRFSPSSASRPGDRTNFPPYTCHVYPSTTDKSEQHTSILLGPGVATKTKTSLVLSMVSHSVPHAPLLRVRRPQTASPRRSTSSNRGQRGRAAVRAGS